MSDEPIIISFKEMAELLVKKKGLHEGFWGIFVRFGIKATNVEFVEPENPQAKSMLPTALIPIVELGIQRFNEPASICVNAAEINPKPTRRLTKGTGKK